MYVQVAHYRLGTGTVEDLRSRVTSDEGPASVMRRSPGFISYHAFDAGDGLVASVAVFESQEALAAVEEQLGPWIGETIETFQIEPGHMSEGPSIASA